MVAALFQTLDTHLFAMFLYGLDERFSPAIRKIPANSRTFPILELSLLTAIAIQYTAYGPAAQVDGGVPVMGVLIDNRPRRARAGAARKRAAPSPC